MQDFSNKFTSSAEKSDSENSTNNSQVRAGMKAAVRSTCIYFNTQLRVSSFLIISNIYVFTALSVLTKNETVSDQVFRSI